MLFLCRSLLVINHLAHQRSARRSTISHKDTAQDKGPYQEHFLLYSLPAGGPPMMLC